MTEDVNAQLQQRIAPFLGQPGPRRWSPRPLETSAIWNFCEAVEDANPVYWDDEIAEASRFGRRIAPPQGLMAFSMGSWWLPEFLAVRAAQEQEAVGPGPSMRAGEVVRDFGFVTATNVTRDEEYLSPYGPGDGRIGSSDTLVDVSPVKQTKVGRGVFITTSIDYVAEKDERLIARAKNVLLMYDSGTPREEQA